MEVRKYSEYYITSTTVYLTLLLPTPIVFSYYPGYPVLPEWKANDAVQAFYVLRICSDDTENYIADLISWPHSATLHHPLHPPWGISLFLQVHQLRGSKLARLIKNLVWEKGREPASPLPRRR